MFYRKMKSSQSCGDFLMHTGGADAACAQRGGEGKYFLLAQDGIEGVSGPVCAGWILRWSARDR